jgi:hypothetical protein
MFDGLGWLALRRLFVCILLAGRSGVAGFVMRTNDHDEAKLFLQDSIHSPRFPICDPNQASLSSLLTYDAAFERLLFDNRPVVHPASIPGMEGRAITIGSASKEPRLIGWRVGWIVGPTWLVPDVRLVGMVNVMVPMGIAQKAAQAALENSDEDWQIALSSPGSFSLDEISWWHSWRVYRSVYQLAVGLSCSGSRAGVAHRRHRWRRNLCHFDGWLVRK